MKILVPDSFGFNVSIPSVDVVMYDVTQPIPESDVDAEILVVWGSNSSQLKQTAKQLTNLRWIQGLAAGSDAIFAAGFDDSVIVTSGRTLHSETVAEHTLALILAAVRSLPELGRLQAKHEWPVEWGSSQVETRDAPLITLHEANVTIWGFGSIAETLAPLLRTLGAVVVGVARSAGERAGFPVISDAELDDRLAVTDILVGILPGTPENHHLIDAHRLAALPKRAWVVNVGRGSTLDEAALVAELNAGGIAGAALDVFEHEPLPPESPLWDEASVIITPHTAGGRPRGASALIERNVRAYLDGQPLENIVRDAPRA